LGLKLSSKTTLQNFIVGANTDFFEKLCENLISGDPFVIYIHGRKNSGKSHLLQGACHELAYRGLQAGYLDLRFIHDLDILKGLDHLKMIAFDNYDYSCPESTENLKVFISNSWSIRRQILISGNDPLPEVFSNIPNIISYEMRELSDLGLMDFLKIKAEEKGLGLPEDVLEYLLSNCHGDSQYLLDHIEKIEERCDREKRKISLKFARTIIGSPSLSQKDSESNSTL
jgi:DnaA family protein